jgi:hypothetical protein
MAFRNTPEAEKAVLKIGQQIVKNREKPLPPSFLKIIPDAIQKEWLLRTDKTSFFRSHLVFNSLYYLSHENILDLDLTTEAVISSYEKIEDDSKARIMLILVKYESDERALSAVQHFQNVYLPEYPFDLDQPFHIYPIENSWLGYKLQDNIVTFVFECPDEETVRIALNEIKY